MDYEEAAQLRYQEMCRIVGDVVFAMVAEGHETKRVAVADVIRTKIVKGAGLVGFGSDSGDGGEAIGRVGQ